MPLGLTDNQPSNIPLTQKQNYLISDLATCLLCVCLSGSVYCEETDMESVPALPKETGYLYARFNKIKKLKVSDFAEIRKYILDLKLHTVLLDYTKSFGKTLKIHFITFKFMSIYYYY